MKFFHAIKEILRDKEKDKLCAGLRDMGLDAQMAEQGRPEEQAVGRLSRWSPKISMGLIEIHGEPIRWINVVRENSGDGGGGGGMVLHNRPHSPRSLCVLERAYRAGPSKESFTIWTSY